MADNQQEQGGKQASTYVELLEHVQIDGVDGKKVFPINLPPLAQTNPSLSITESVDGTVTTTTIQQTIGTDVYQQTIEEDSSDNSVIVSAWSEL